MSSAFDFKNPNYGPIYKRRLLMAKKIIVEKVIPFPKLFEFYKENPVNFIEDWCLTADPRAIQPNMPFILFPFQKEFIIWLYKKFLSQECGLVEKSRDMGATWLCAAFSVWVWLFHENRSVGWCSQKQASVDKLGDMNSIFEKIRFLIRNLPIFLRPPGLDPRKHLLYARVINPVIGSTIIGEFGNNAGRGGRCSMYIKDESAHYQNSELIEAALSQTSNCKIDVSTPNGVDNEFYRKRHDTDIDVFVMDWRNDPRKDRDWYELQKKILPPMILAQEIDRDYLRSRDDVIFPTDWVRESIEIDQRYEINPEGLVYAGLDVAYDGQDNSVLVIRKGFKTLSIHEWSNRTPTDTARKAVTFCIESEVDILNYDAIGMGAGVDGELKSIKEELEKEGRKIDLKAYGVKVGLPADDKKSTRGLTFRDRFFNLKAQIFWQLRERFQFTFNYCQGQDVSLEDIICLPNDQKLLKQLYSITYLTTKNGKIEIGGKKKMTKSPDIADALALAYYNPRRTIKVWAM